VGDGPSNPHMSLEFNGEIFVPDLGADKFWRIVNDGAPGLFRVQGQIDVVPGNGPRHIAIQDNILFTLHEKSSSLTAQPVPMAPNGTTLPLIANVSIVPPDQPQGSTFAAAEILISRPTPKFLDPLIYVSNRNTATPEFLDPRGDAIAIFEFQPPSAGEGGGGGDGDGPEPVAESAALPFEDQDTELEWDVQALDQTGGEEETSETSRGRSWWFGIAQPGLHGVEPD